MPQVSIIVPCYNQAQYLDECLQSVLQQSYQDWECIVVNDGSSDDTELVANKWIEKDSRFKYLHKINGGLSSARNAGIAIAKGIWVLPLDADDYISSDYLQLAATYFDKSETVKLIYAAAQKFGAINGSWDLPVFSYKNLAISNPVFCSAFYQKKDWEIIGGYDEQMKAGLEDWDFWISLLKNGGIVEKIEKVCFYYRTKENSMITSFVSDISKRNNTIQYIELKHYDFFVQHLGNIHTLYEDNAQIKARFYGKAYRWYNKCIDWLLKLKS